ncbi:MAG: class I SAM-dependent methyltransferase [Gammaproteobacteria bacterium]
MTNGIYQDGRHYDQMFGPDGNVEFFRDEARALGGPVLELACGTGRILQPIADAGIAATGIDVAPGMLAEARRRAHSGGTSPARYLQEDMRSCHLNERFALIFIAGNSICHLLDIDSFQECMARVREHLAEGGHFIVDVFVPRLQLLLVDPSSRQRLSEYDAPDGSGRVVVTSQSHYDPIAQIKFTKTFHHFPGGAPEVEGSLDMRMYFPQELQALLRYNGFRIAAAYGGFDRGPLTGASAKQIYVAEAVAEP